MMTAGTVVMVAVVLPERERVRVDVWTEVVPGRLVVTVRVADGG
jgi:hypothetical protein